MASRRFQTVLLGVFSSISLLLALVGLYGLLAFSVKQREREIGVRIAIGASQASIVSLIVRQGLWLVIIGLVAGLIGALALQQVLRSFLFGTQAADPVVLLVVPMLLLTTSLVSCAIPGWRAAKVDPATSLRSE